MLPALRSRTFCRNPCRRLYSKQEKKSIVDDMFRRQVVSSKPSLVHEMIRYFEEPKQPGTLIILRHGESEWNARRLFTGWVDADLSERGRRETEHAARLLLERGYTADICYTSSLKRAIRSSWIILNELGRIYRPCVKTWRLNERMYGAIEGHSKPGLARVLGVEQVQRWRTGVSERPPDMSPEHVYWHGNDRQYKNVAQEKLPRVETLADTIARTIPIYDSHISNDLYHGRNVLIVAHRNSIRGIISRIEGLDVESVQKISIPNGIPLVYKFDSNMKPLKHEKSQDPLRGIWLEKKGLLKAALEREDKLASTLSMLKPYSFFTSGTGAASGTSSSLAQQSSPNASASDQIRAYYQGALEGSAEGNSAVVTNGISSDLLKDTTKLEKIAEVVAASVAGAVVETAGISDPNLVKNLSRLEAQRQLLQLLGDTSSELIMNNTGAEEEIFGDDDTVVGGSAAAAAAGAGDIASAVAGSGGTGITTGASPDIFIDPKIVGDEHVATSVTEDVSASSPLVQSVGSIDYNNLNHIHYFENSAEAITVRAMAAAKELGDSVDAAAGDRPKDPVLERPLLIIIRHGKTEHNKLGLFTGWEDASLANEGRTEARYAGKLLRRHAVEFDVVYTSWLSRAIETAWLVLNELDTLWLPIVKTWHLNERMYGALTGLSKKMIRQMYGQDQFKKWRRGFNEPPPPISPFSQFYPGNDKRYVSYVEDLPVSLFETFIRSLAHGRLELHRKFPKSESLKNCMDRTIPYFTNVIVPESVSPGKNVLIASSENAIRGLLMHLCDIKQENISSVEIPTGLPLIYDSAQRKIRLLEEDVDNLSEEDRNKSYLERYNFGDSPELLFKSRPRGKTSPSSDAQHVSGKSDRVVVYDDDILIKCITETETTQATKP